MYTLIGSLTSPYARRIRLYLDGVNYKFETINYLDGRDDARLASLNPIKRIPVLMIDGRPLWESRVIYYFLQRELQKPSLSFEEENAVSAIDALQDLLIQTFLMQRVGHSIDRNNPYFIRHSERHRLILDYLVQEISAGRFSRWDYPAISLYSLADWALFRKCYTLENLPREIAVFLEERRNLPFVLESDPRLA